MSNWLELKQSHSGDNLEKALFSGFPIHYAILTLAGPEHVVPHASLVIS